mmetsp:Transcript_28861/g.47838  ORF Transcript_28861/g.47838 Transcript_28861/m.47838 type:complete len:204 (-) Transcript_28861:84-695(-)
MSAEAAVASCGTHFGSTVMILSTDVVFGSSPAANSFRVTSVSVKMPARAPPQIISATSVLADAILRAAATTLVPASMKSPGRARSSATVFEPWLDGDELSGDASEARDAADAFAPVAVCELPCKALGGDIMGVESQSETAAPAVPDVAAAASTRCNNALRALLFIGPKGVATVLRRGRDSAILNDKGRALGLCVLGSPCAELP